MPTIRTTINPETPIDVSETEFIDLTRQGLIAPDQPAPLTRPTVAPDAPKETK
jgi:hypothetical protein